MVRQFIQQKVIDKEEKYGVLSLNKKSFEVLSGKRIFDGYPPPADKVKSKARNVSRITNYDGSLSDALRKKRKEMADAKGVPPYVIFSDKSLVDMCQQLPQNKKEFIQIFGVGDQKLEKYGDIFLKIIRKHHN